MGLTYRFSSLRDPTATLHDLYNDPNGTSHDNFPRLVAEHYTQIFHTSEAFREIPSLDIRSPPTTFPDRSLVRFRAMVQDTSPSSEMYLARSPNGKCGGWGIELTEEENGEVDYTNLRECNVLWAVSVPAESAWCAEELDGSQTRSASGSTSAYLPQHSHKFPHPTLPHIGVQVKIYDTDSAEKLKSTDIVTFVGILTTESSISLSYSSADLLTARTSVSSTGTGLESRDEVPTLHVLYIREHTATLLSRPYPSTATPDADEHSAPAKVRSELISWMAEEALGGDREAAEWMLLASIARVQSRSPPLLPPSLNLTHFPSPSPTPSTTDAPPTFLPTLSTVLAQILPLTHTLPLSLDVLNKDAFVPESKEEDLHAGVLQLPQGTVLLVTEGGVHEGKLDEQGILNVHALQEVMNTQTLAYKFPFSQFSFPTDISCIVVSEGSKSAFFRTNISVPLTAPKDPEAIARLYKPVEDINLPSAERLAAFRDLLVGARAGKVHVSEETSEHIQRDFVRERQQDRSVTSDDLIRRMSIAKLYALSLHETELTVDVWERAKAFDERRRAACASTTTSSATV
ncbi:hypothetical protein IEO21_06763 [Rhodonia placenta]|uniref:Mini-chromosome maintenance complex-binding protein n=1 Tax=Rhodonia placenta TaxID=104341 RepID=A0A8H7NZH1_9APHY|nr:hypothetical protein IEO21_06763 [Postia placenta]